MRTFHGSQDKDCKQSNPIITGMEQSSQKRNSGIGEMPQWLNMTYCSCKGCEFAF